MTQSSACPARPRAVTALVVNRSPYRAAEASEHLGGIVSSHKPRIGQYVRALFRAPGIFVIALFTGVQGFEAAVRDDWLRRRAR